MDREKTMYLKIFWRILALIIGICLVMLVFTKKDLWTSYDLTLTSVGIFSIVFLVLLSFVEEEDQCKKGSLTSACKKQKDKNKKLFAPLFLSIFGLYILLLVLIYFLARKKYIPVYREGDWYYYYGPKKNQ